MKRRLRWLAAIAVWALAPSAALAHPHLPGDPFADLASDTLVAGSPRFAPLAAGHARARLTDARGGLGTLVATIERRITREDSPAGRRWCVAIERRDPSGSVIARDSIWVTAGPPIPIYHSRTAALDSLGVAYDARQLSGRRARGGGMLLEIERSLRSEAFPLDLWPVLVTRLTLQPGLAVGIAVADESRLPGDPETVLAVHVVGETRLDSGGHEHRCWLLTLDRADDPADLRTLWIDRGTHALLREERRDASGNLTAVLEAE